MSKITFNNKENPFFKSLNAKVDEYFKTKRLHTAGNQKLYYKGLLQICTATLLYVTLVFFTPNALVSIVLCCLLGSNMALIGFNVMHEGGHQTFSRYKWLNQTSSYFLNILGGSAFFWKIKHNINHHTYTNIEGLDTDMEVEPFMRLHDTQPKYWFHRFQHIYWVILYGMSYLTWIFVADFYKYFTGDIAPGNENKKLDLKEHLIFWTTKLFYVTAYIVLPAFTVGIAETAIGFFVITFVCGLFISIVFQLAHIVEHTRFPKPNAVSNKIEQEWAIHQVNTTANFATKSKLLYWMLGGLNFQVEHHLFPKISHIHYPKINQFVRETCLEFNVVYVEYPSLHRAFYSHLKHIRRLGRA